jgi:hypothetical protein
MASLEILDGTGIARDLLVTIIGSDYVPHHIVESSALPTGAATQATLATIDADTGSMLTLIGTIDTDTGAIAASTASIDGKITACNTGAVVLAAGTANIGDVDVLTLPALAAGTNLIGSIAAAGATTTIYNGVTPLTVKYAKIGCAASGDNTLVAGVTSKKIRVIALFLAATGTAVNVYFRENTGGTAIGFDATYSLTLDKTGATGPSGLSLPSNPTGHFESSAGNPLVINLSTAQGVGGWLSYVEV